jgi:hypothetical protein
MAQVVWWSGLLAARQLLSLALSGKGPLTHRPEGQGDRMKKLLFTVVMLAAFGVTLVGCRAEGEIDTASNVPALQ